MAENSQDTGQPRIDFDSALFRSTRKLAMALTLIINIWIRGYAELTSQERASNGNIYEIDKCLCWKTTGKCFKMSSRIESLPTLTYTFLPPSTGLNDTLGKYTCECYSGVVTSPAQEKSSTTSGWFCKKQIDLTN